MTMKRFLPFAAAALMLAALIMGIMLLGGAGKKKDTSFDGASFVHLSDEPSDTAAFFVPEGTSV